MLANDTRTSTYALSTPQRPINLRMEHGGCRGADKTTLKTAANYTAQLSKCEKAKLFFKHLNLTRISFFSLGSGGVGFVGGVGIAAALSITGPAGWGIAGGIAAGFILLFIIRGCYDAYVAMRAEIYTNQIKMRV